MEARDDYSCYDEKWQFTNILRDGCTTGRSIVGLEYDDPGNLKNKIGRLFAFDKGNRLRRIFTRAPDLTETTLDHMYLAGDPVAQVEVDRTTGAAANRYMHTDALGSPVVVTNGPRVEQERGEYEPYGWVINRPLRDGPGYTGHEDACRFGEHSKRLALGLHRLWKRFASLRDRLSRVNERIQRARQHVIFATTSVFCSSSGLQRSRERL